MNKVLALLGVLVVAIVVYTALSPQIDDGSSSAEVAQASGHTWTWKESCVLMTAQQSPYL